MTVAVQKVERVVPEKRTVAPEWGERTRESMCVGERGRVVRVAWQEGVERVVVRGSGWVRVGWREGGVGRVDVDGCWDGEVVVGGFAGEVVGGASIGGLEAMMGGCGGGEVEDMVGARRG